MADEDLEQVIRERAGGKDSVGDQVRIAKFLYENDYTPTSDGIKRKELVNALESAGVDTEYTVGTSLSHLRDIGLVKRWIRGPQILIIHDDRGVVNGEDLEEIIDEEVESLISAVQDDDPQSSEGDSTAVADGGERPLLRTVVANGLSVNGPQVEETLRTGDVPERMEKLQDAIQGIEESELDRADEFNEVFFIHNPYRYALSVEAVDLMES